MDESEFDAFMRWVCAHPQYKNGRIIRVPDTGSTSINLIRQPDPLVLTCDKPVSDLNRIPVDFDLPLTNSGQIVGFALINGVPHVGCALEPAGV
jgi:hypothetical protein